MCFCGPILRNAQVFSTFFGWPPKKAVRAWLCTWRHKPCFWKAILVPHRTLGEVSRSRRWRSGFFWGGSHTVDWWKKSLIKSLGMYNKFLVNNGIFAYIYCFLLFLIPCHPWQFIFACKSFACNFVRRLEVFGVQWLEDVGFMNRSESPTAGLVQVRSTVEYSNRPYRNILQCWVLFLAHGPFLGMCYGKRRW